MIQTTRNRKDREIWIEEEDGETIDIWGKWDWLVYVWCKSERIDEGDWWEDFVESYGIWLEIACQKKLHHSISLSEWEWFQ